MSDLKVGDTVTFTCTAPVLQVGDDLVELDIHSLSVWVYTRECEKIEESPEAGEVWVCTNGTRGFFYFNSNDRLTFVTTHGQHFYPEQISADLGWSKEDV